MRNYYDRILYVVTSVDYLVDISIETSARSRED